MGHRVRLGPQQICLLPGVVEHQIGPAAALTRHASVHTVSTSALPLRNMAMEMSS